VLVGLCIVGVLFGVLLSVPVRGARCECCVRVYTLFLSTVLLLFLRFMVTFGFLCHIFVLLAERKEG
jgi:hypothetical protein